MNSELKTISLSEIMIILIFMAALHIMSGYSFLLFHSIAEIFSIVIATSLFFVTWFSKKTIKNNYFLLLGIAYLFIAGIDLLHTLLYKGMGVFPTQSHNLSTQLWIVARYMEAATLLIAPFIIRRKLKASSMLIVYGIITTILLILVFKGIFPVCYVDGVGLTAFKKISEYVISVMLLASLSMLWKHSNQFEPLILNMLSVSIVLTIFAELTFTLYVGIYGFSNLIGHLFKLLSFYFIFKAIIVTALVRPNDLFSKDLVLKESMLKEEKERYQELFKNMSNGVVVIETRDNGQSFIFKDINLAAEQICHKDKNKIIDKHLAEIYATLPECNLMDIIHQVWTTGKSKLIPEFQYHDKHIEAWWELYVYKLTNGEVVMVIKDITKNKKLEESQEELHEMLKVINKIMRHDISNDLSIISMSLEVFEENSDKKYLELSQKSVKRCLKKINEMRNLEQTISNQYELKPYNLHDVVTEVSRNHLVKISMNGSCVVMADEGLFSVVDNIITNAVNHGAATHIETTVKLNDTNVCSMRIADNGSGIPPSIKEHIFKEGFKYGEKGNTGLGLYIAKTIMSRYGSISAEDNSPSGAVFILTFSKHH